MCLRFHVPCFTAKTREMMTRFDDRTLRDSRNLHQPTSERILRVDVMSCSRGERGTTPPQQKGERSCNRNHKEQPEPQTATQRNLVGANVQPDRVNSQYRYMMLYVVV